jgi:surface antigen
MSLRLLVALAAVTWAAPAGTGTRAAAGPVIYGYPYASRCPGAGIADEVDRWGMYVCNCTSYVAWALQANGRRTDWFIAGAMNAWNWPHVARLAGFRVGATPRAGAVAVWPRLAPPFGHVAYVTRVRADGGIDVAEYNLPGADGFEPYLFDRRMDAARRGAVFIYVPRASRADRGRARA